MSSVLLFWQAIIAGVFDKVTLAASSLEDSKRFYETVLAALEHEPTGPARWSDFELAQATDEGSVTRRLHIGFSAPSRDHVDAFWRAGTGAGYRDDGSPGPRTQYRQDYYGAFLLDPDGNSAEAVHHGALRADGTIDHLWIRVADVAGAKRHYEGVAADKGFRLDADTPERAQFVGGSGSFSLVSGEPTENLQMALTRHG